MHLKYLCFLLVLPFILAFANNDPGKGKIAGKVIDAVTQEPVIGANIIILGKTSGAAADINGEFTINNLEEGSYQLSVSAVGYTTVTKTDVIVTLSKTTQIEFQLREAVIEIGTVTVTNNYFSKSPTEVNSISSFSYEEIRRAPGGFEDVVRALSVLPGVAQADAGRNDLIVRGGAPSENLYIIDGIEIPNINHFGNQGATGGPLSYINLDFVKQTSFSTGGFSPMFGDKISSVLDIDLRNGRKDRIGGKVTVSASQFGLNAEGPAGDNLNFIFSARRSYLDFIFKAAGFGFVPEYYDVLSKNNYKINGKNSVSFLFIGAFDRVKYFNNTPDQRYDNSRILGSNQNQYAAGITYTGLFANGFAKIILSRNYTGYETSQKDSLLRPLFSNSSLEAENGLKADVIMKIFHDSELNFGAEIKQVKFKADIFNPGFQTTFGESLPGLNLNTGNYNTKSSFYVNFNKSLNEKINANAGFRFDYFDAIKNKIYLSPRFSVSYNLNPVTDVNFSTGIYRQSPSSIWLAYGGNSTRLSAIKAFQFILGLERRVSEDMQMKIETFVKLYDDYPGSLTRPYLVMSNTGAGFSGSSDNFASFGLEPLASVGKGTARGAEFSFRKKLSGIPAYGLASVTYSKADFKAADGITRPGSYDQRWIINVSGGYKFAYGWEASMKFRYSSGNHYTPFNNDGSQNVSEYNLYNLPPNHSLDIRVDKRWSFETWTLITYIDIQNIYNRKNPTYIRWDSRSMSPVYNSSIGVLPSIGISAEI